MSLLSIENLEQLTPEELVELARGASESERARYLDELYRRFYPKVSSWCLRVCGDAERARDVAQEVFLRVHTRLDSFQGASKFSTWLYTVTRRVAINRMQAERLRKMVSIDSTEGFTDRIPDAERSQEDAAIVRELAGRLREAIEHDLDPLEARVLYLHFVDGMSLPAITELLKLENKSGAKAFVVGGKRKLMRRFGRWLAAQDRGDGSS